MQFDILTRTCVNKVYVGLYIDRVKHISICSYPSNFSDVQGRQNYKVEVEKSNRSIYACRCGCIYPLTLLSFPGMTWEAPCNYLFILILIRSRIDMFVSRRGSRCWRIWRHFEGVLPVAGILFLRLTLVDGRSLPWSGRGWALRVGLAGGFVRLGRENLGLARMGDVRYEEDVRYW